MVNILINLPYIDLYFWKKHSLHCFDAILSFSYHLILYLYYRGSFLYQNSHQEHH